jgi:hypothetical protein
VGHAIGLAPLEVRQHGETTMIDLKYCTRVFVILIAFAALGSFSALADRVVLAGEHSPSEIKAACGGDFAYDGAAYGCTKTAGDGSKTSITCSWDGKCIGSCTTCGPAIAKQKNPVLGVLSGGALKPLQAKQQSTPTKGSDPKPTGMKQEQPMGGMDHSEHGGGGKH